MIVLQIQKEMILNKFTLTSFVHMLLFKFYSRKPSGNQSYVCTYGTERHTSTQYTETELYIKIVSC